ncbi:MAG: DUF4160 domain-containing protein [Bacteroidota bacterium]
MHVEKGEGYGKYWLEPIKKDYMKNFTKKEEKQAHTIVQEEQENFKRKWYEYFG